MIDLARTVLRNKYIITTATIYDPVLHENDPPVLTLDFPAFSPRTLLHNQILLASVEEAQQDCVRVNIGQI